MTEASLGMVTIRALVPYHCSVPATPARRICTFLVVVMSNSSLLSKHLTIFRRYFATHLLVAKLLVKYTAHSVSLHKFFKVGASCSCP